MSVGFRIITGVKKPEKELIEKFKELGTAVIADCMSRFYVLNHEIKRVSKPGIRMAGAAITVKTRPGDNLMLHKAISMAGPEDVIIVDNSQERNRALAGSIMFNYAKFKGIAGIVLDGPIRDIEEVSVLEFPVYATGVTPMGPDKDGPGEINVNISCGCVSVKPGDIVVGDEDGVVVIPQEDAEALLEKVVAYKAKDDAKTQAAATGAVDRSWVDKLLLEKGCEYIEK